MDILFEEWISSSNDSEGSEIEGFGSLNDACRTIGKGETESIAESSVLMELASNLRGGFGRSGRENKSLADSTNDKNSAKMDIEYSTGSLL